MITRTAADVLQLANHQMLLHGVIGFEICVSYLHAHIQQESQAVDNLTRTPTNSDSITRLEPGIEKPPGKQISRDESEPIDQHHDLGMAVEREVDR